MKVFKDKVAVITGASNGIGFGIAQRCALEGMKVVLAGINYENLVQAEETLKTLGTKTLCVKTDVSKLSDIKALAQETIDTFDEVHLLVNNAGVGAGGTIWESTMADWEWVMDVNLWGVIYGVKIFVPLMLKQNTEGHIINTSSIAGLIPYHPAAPYQVTKQAVIALSENLHRSLENRNSKIKVSVLCPGWVKTRILDSERNRPLELRNEEVSNSEERKKFLEQARKEIEAGMSIEEVADYVFRAIKKEQLFILTHREYDSILEKRFEEILK
jgi:NAD(P)-dependent dehydrogenase (short-subunit alcohol dehydrogenase family)